MKKLTQRQQQILDFVINRVDETGMPPTRMEIAEEFGFRSANAAEEHLRALARKGAIEMLVGASRGIRVITSKPNGIPIIGEVAAGHPVLAEENISGYCELAANTFTPKADYFLRVKGLSMKDIGIMEGDLLGVHRTTEVRKGQIVVARIGSEVTVKRFERQRNKIILHPENPDFEPIEVDSRSEEFAIEGLGVGILRDGL